MTCKWWCCDSNTKPNSSDFSGSPVVKTVIPLQAAWVRSLVVELRSHITHSVVKKKKRPPVLVLKHIPRCLWVSTMRLQRSGKHGNVIHRENHTQVTCSFEHSVIHKHSLTPGMIAPGCVIGADGMNGLRLTNARWVHRCSLYCYSLHLIHIL